MTKESEHWIDSAKPTDNEMALAIAGFVMMQPDRCASEEEIKKFADQLWDEVVGARFINGSFELLNQCKIVACWNKDGELSWKLPSEQERKELLAAAKKLEDHGH